MHQNQAHHIPWKQRKHHIETRPYSTTLIPVANQIAVKLRVQFGVDPIAENARKITVNIFSIIYANNSPLYKKNIIITVPSTRCHSSKTERGGTCVNFCRFILYLNFTRICFHRCSLRELLSLFTVLCPFSCHCFRCLWLFVSKWSVLNFYS